jgi:integrase
VRNTGVGALAKVERGVRALRWHEALALAAALGTDLDDFVFHELRHTAAALAIATGAHPLTIKERLAHSNIAVTMDLYAHRYPNQDAALVELLDTSLANAEHGRIGLPYPQVRRLEHWRRP